MKRPFDIAGKSKRAFILASPERQLLAGMAAMLQVLGAAQVHYGNLPYEQRDALIDMMEALNEMLGAWAAEDYKPTTP